MKGVLGNAAIKDRSGQRWTRGVVVSLLFHVLIFSLVLFVPESMPTRRIGGSTIYEVNLVEMPTLGRPAAGPPAPAATAEKKVESPKPVPEARRIAPPPPPPEEKAVAISKRVVERKPEEKKAVPKPPKPEVSPSKLIDGAIAKIEKKVKTEKTDHLTNALSRVESKVKADQPDHLSKALSQIETRSQGQGQGFPGEGGAETGITIRMYQLAVEEQIKGNWSYPVALTDPKKRKDLRATVIVKVQQDGTVLKSWFKERSASPIFDGSVLKAIERSDPLPPFPEGYKRISEEFEIRFDLSEMEEG